MLNSLIFLSLLAYFGGDTFNLTAFSTYLGLHQRKSENLGSNGNGKASKTQNEHKRLSRTAARGESGSAYPSGLEWHRNCGDEGCILGAGTELPSRCVLRLPWGWQLLDLGAVWPDWDLCPSPLRASKFVGPVAVFA